MTQFADICVSNSKIVSHTSTLRTWTRILQIDCGWSPKGNLNSSTQADRSHCTSVYSLRFRYIPVFRGYISVMGNTADGLWKGAAAGVCCTCVTGTALTGVCGVCMGCSEGADDTTMAAVSGGLLSTLLLGLPSAVIGAAIGGIGGLCEDFVNAVSALTRALGRQGTRGTLPLAAALTVAVQRKVLSQPQAEGRLKAFCVEHKGDAHEVRMEAAEAVGREILTLVKLVELYPEAPARDVQYKVRINPLPISRPSECEDEVWRERWGGYGYGLGYGV